MMKTIKVIYLLLVLLSLLVAAHSVSAQATAGNSTDSQTGLSKQSNSEQPVYRKGVLEFHLGKGSVGGDLKSAFSNSFNGGITFGWRFQRYLQADLGFDFSRGAARVSRAINSTGGYRTVGDDELFVPVGGRFILPLAKERVQLSVGGGFAYLKYAESARPGANEIVICTSCGERTGRGSYEMAQIKFLVDRQRHFGIGFTAKVFQGKTSGASLGTTLPYTTKDRWTVLAGTFSLHL